MSRYLTIHAHLYQPPRENPWLEEVELQDSAWPHHDWNARITSECYAPNTASRILDADRRIIDIVNNYAKISFNFGPTLLSWMERHQPKVYSAIVYANELSKKRFNGHSSAIAQVYNHMIMPLANTRDKKTQILWGIRDYRKRFGGRPEGIWLSETAVDLETLELCVDQGITYTILAPRQARRVRKIGDKEWEDVTGDAVDPKRPYRCTLPSGKHIALFFYDGHVSQEVAFGGVLDDGKRFSDRLLSVFDDNGEADQLVHIATDGETYGHHHRFGDMALAYCLYHIEQDESVELTIYGAYLEDHPPEYEVEIFEDSSWSCVHGVERWRNACGCNSGMHGDWQQAWRAPLRGAMDWLRDSLAMLYEEHAAEHLKDPWAARDDYIEIILDRSDESLRAFFEKHACRDLSPDDRVAALKLLELQRHAMLMYTSCGWFFDEISGIETVQVIQYAARAMQLARDVAGIDLEPAYIKILERAPSNHPDFENGAEVYQRYVQPAVLDLLRVGAHYAVLSLFQDEPTGSTDIYSYSATSEKFDRFELGRQRLAVGKATLQSHITREQSPLHFAVLHLGEQNLLGGVRRDMTADQFEDVHARLKDAFERSNIAEVIAETDEHLGTHAYSLWHLFKDEQRSIMKQIVDDLLVDEERHFRRSYERYYPIMQATNEMKVPLPSVLSTTVSFVLNTDLRKVLAEEPLNLERLAYLTSEARKWNIEYEKTILGFEASGRVNELMDRLEANPEDLTLMEQLEHFLRILNDLPIDLDVWRAQNMYFNMGKTVYPEKAGLAEKSDRRASQWVELFNKLGSHLHVRSH